HQNGIGNLMMPRWNYLLLVYLFVSGCSAGSGEGLDNNGRPLDEGSGGGPLVAEFQSIQDNVLTPVCTICHAGAGAPVGLRLDQGNSFAMLVDVPSVQVPTLLRVDPGDPDNSYLIQKMEGSASVGGRMPLNGPPLSQATIDVVRSWVAAGALAPADGGGGLLPRVTSIAPAQDERLTVVPTEITIVFNKAMDASTLNTTTIQLTSSGGDGSFGDGNETSFTTFVVQLASNGLSATVDLSALGLADDTYQITLSGDSPSFLLDTEGLRLDGDDDGAEGGDFVSSFTIEIPVVGLQPTWRSIQDNIFTPMCITCHAGAGAPAGLQLDEDNSFNMLVNIPSSQVPTLLRVEPGDPDDSYLVQKLEGTQTVGGRMPQGGPFLEQSDIDVVRTWVTDGAPQ
ncbi:MAG: Ig-like domain-containing protein, partial [Pseudomonadota bacterium]